MDTSIAVAWFLFLSIDQYMLLHRFKMRTARITEPPKLMRLAITKLATTSVWKRAVVVVAAAVGVGVGVAVTEQTAVQKVCHCLQWNWELEVKMKAPPHSPRVACGTAVKPGCKHRIWVLDWHSLVARALRGSGGSRTESQVTG